MIKKIALLKELSLKVGKRKTKEIISILESDDSFRIEIKIMKKEVSNKKDVIMLKDGQEVILEYVEV